MSRPFKDGADYFPKDCGFYRDDKIKILRCEFGAKGMYLLDYLLCELYEKNGYFMEWDKRKCYLVSEGAGCGCSPNFIEEFIDGCIRESIFNQEVFDMFGVLTSYGIQRRFVRMLNSRKKFTFIEEYFLLDRTNEDDVPAGILVKLSFKKINDKENPVINKENPVICTDNSQRKGEEKERESIKRGSLKQKHPHGEYKNVFLSEAEFQKLQTEFPDWSQRIDRLSEYMESTGKKYKNHYVTIKAWSKNDFPKLVSKNKFVSGCNDKTVSEDDLLALQIQERRMKNEQQT